MDISELVLKCKEKTPQFISSYCIVNGAFMNLTDVENMGYDEFSCRSKINMPVKLYKYFPNVSKKEKNKETNYSLHALINNTVFMQSPNEFDDIYDSDINLDYSVYERIRLMEYCKRCQINVNEDLSTDSIGDLFISTLFECYNKTGRFDSVFTKYPETKSEELANDIFYKKLIIEINKNNDLGYVVRKIIESDYEEYLLYLKNTFRTSCFATTPYSQLMWGGAYADCHRGFCLEYSILPNEKKYEKIYKNLFPMIYCKVRPDMTEKLAKIQDKDLTLQSLWDIYFHGALRKSIDWAYQNEWRLLMPMKCKNIKDYNIEFFPITKVFLGNRMSKEQRKIIIDICKDRNIPYTGVMRNPSVFEMQDCNIKCEECPQFINK